MRRLLLAGLLAWPAPAFAQGQAASSSQAGTVVQLSPALPGNIWQAPLNAAAGALPGAIPGLGGPSLLGALGLTSTPAPAATQPQGEPLPETEGPSLERTLDFAQRSLETGDDVSAETSFRDLFDAGTISMLEELAPFEDVAAETLRVQTLRGEHTAQSMVPPHVPGRERYVRAFSRVLAVADRSDWDPRAREFTRVMGRRYARVIYDAKVAPLRSRMRRPQAVQEGALAQGGPALPPNPLGRGEYWDLASGTPDLILGGFDAKTSYRFVDISEFMVSMVTSFLARLSADGQNVSNLRMEQGDVLELERPRAPLAVIRAKNVVAYVPGFTEKLGAMVDWLEPGGRVYIQNDPSQGQRWSIKESYTPLALRLLEEGWGLGARFAIEAQQPGDAHYDALALIKPSGPPARRSPREARALWGAYLEKAAQVSVAEALMAALGAAGFDLR